MITRIVLRNFQKHKKLDLIIDQLTTFVGKSDAGKSAIVRALRWVLLNQPKGSSFIRNGAKKCSVTLWIDGNIVKRSKTPSSNTYSLNGEVFRSFPNGVPDAIQNVLRVGLENFQQQHDPVFWLSLSPTEISKKLNEIADLQIMDDAIRKANSIKREAEHKVKFCLENRKATKEKVASMSRVPEAIEQFQSLQTKAEKLVAQKTQVARLRSIVITLEETTIQAEKLETACTAARKLAKAERGLVHDQAELNLLRVCVEQVKRYEKVRLLVPVVSFADLNENYWIIRELSGLVDSIHQYEKEIAQCSLLLENLKDSMSVQTCPTCGNPMRTNQKSTPSR